MHQGNWKCSGCGGTITELPFQPRSETGLTCRACYAKQKGTSPAPAATNTTSAPEQSQDVPIDAGFADVPADPFEGMDMGGAVSLAPGEKPKFAGDWQCAGCGASISSLPFQPRDTSNLKCLDCFKQSKG